MTKITAHKGYSKNYPENTLLAFQKAVEAGAERIELDVHLTKDKKLVVFHDQYLERTTKKEGVIDDLSYEDISSLDAGSWFGESFAGERIPLLEQVIKTVPNKIGLEIEIKDPSLDLIEQVLRLVNHRDSVEITSPYHFVLSSIRQKSKIEVGVFVKEKPVWLDEKLYSSLLLSELNLGGVDTAHLPQSLLTQEVVEYLRKHGKKIHAANCDTETELKKAYDLKVDQLSTTDVQLAVEVRQEYER